MTNENVTKAVQAMYLVVSDLQAALKTATPVEGMLLLDSIETATKLRTRLIELEKAMN